MYLGRMFSGDRRSGDDIRAICGRGGHRLPHRRAQGPDGRARTEAQEALPAARLRRRVTRWVLALEPGHTGLHLIQGSGKMPNLRF
jgi:hypothetical protein